MKEYATVVAMVTCNGGEYLGRQFASILKQSELPEAMVIADDASTDSTKSLIDEFAEAAPFKVEVIRHESRIGVHKNAGSCFQRAAELGEIVIVCDQDDLWAPIKVERLHTVFAERPAAMLWFSDATVVDQDDRPIATSLWDVLALDPVWKAGVRTGDGYDRLIHGDAVTGPTMAMRSVVVEHALPLPDDRDEDGVLFYQDGWIAVLARLMGEIVTDPEPLTLYRRHPHQMSAAFRNGDPDDGKRPGIAERRANLANDYRRVKMISEHVRANPEAPWIREAADEIGARAAFFAVRTAPKGSKHRRRDVLAQLRAGKYSRYASGARTAVYDLLDPFHGERI